MDDTPGVSGVAIDHSLLAQDQDLNFEKTLQLICVLYHKDCSGII